MIKGDKIRLKVKMGVFDNIGEICEVTDVQEGGIICFKFGGCHLGCMSFDEYEKYFELVKTPTKKPWSEWIACGFLEFIDIYGKTASIKYQYRENSKKIQIRSECKYGVIRTRTSCHDEDNFDLNKGLILAEKRLIAKYLNKQVKTLAKTM